MLVRVTRQGGSVLMRVCKLNCVTASKNGFRAWFLLLVTQFKSQTQNQIRMVAVRGVQKLQRHEGTHLGNIKYIWQSIHDNF